MPKDIQPLTSPLVWTFTDYLDRSLVVSVAFNVNNRSLQGVTVERAVGCLYRKLYWGLGPDGTPDSTTRTFTVPEGITSVSKGQLGSVGLNTLDDVLAVQFTVGP